MSSLAMARLIAVVGALGVLATVVETVQGYVLPHQPAALMSHAATGLVACLLVLFAQAWFAVSSAFVARAPGLLAAGGDGGHSTRRQLQRHAKTMVGAGVLAVLVSALAFVSGLLAYTREVPPMVHGGLALAAIAAQTAALWIALRLARETEDAARALDRSS